MQKNSLVKVMFSVALISGATYFLFYTEAGREWLDRLKNIATDKLDQWLADLEERIQEMELVSSGDPQPNV